MATYAIGDIQGCYDDLMRLLEALQFDEGNDRLWFAGDLVNRGPDSLSVLRFVSGLGDRAITVLGNHDLHLLAMVHGNPKGLKEAGLRAIVDASDGGELTHWLQQRPLLHRDELLGYTLIHAGLPPQWSLAQAIACAGEVEGILRGEGARAYFEQMYGDEPSLWNDDLQGMERYRFITNAFTRLRYCSLAGEMAMQEKGRPGKQAHGLKPWYQVPWRKSRDDAIIFGHWSTLGYQQVFNTWAIDTGCLWGGELTALRLDVPVPIPMSINCPGAMPPGKE